MAVLQLFFVFRILGSISQSGLFLHHGFGLSCGYRVAFDGVAQHAIQLAEMLMVPLRLRLLC